MKLRKQRKSKQLLITSIHLAQNGANRNQNCTKSEIGKTRSSNNVRNYPLYRSNIYFYASLKEELIFMF